MSKDFNIPSPNTEHRTLDSPEHRLWIAVLKSLFREAKKVKGTGRAIDFVHLVEGDYYLEICDLIGISHDYLVEEMERTLGFREQR